MFTKGVADWYLWSLMSRVQSDNMLRQRSQTYIWKYRKFHFMQLNNFNYSYNCKIIKNLLLNSFLLSKLKLLLELRLNTFVIMFRFQMLKPLTTDITLKRSLSCMHWHVSFNMILRVEPSITNSTLKKKIIEK